MKSMNAGWRVLVITLLAAVLPVQAAMYKWVDDNGQVHYSANPPPELKRDQVKKMEINTTTPDQPAPEAKQEGEVARCGSIMLPKKLPNPMARVAQLRGAMAIWQKYLDENSGSSDEKIQRGVTDRRCAIEFADRELQSLSDVEDDLENNYRRVNDELEELQRRVAECNEVQPEAGEPSAYECRRQFEKRISELKKMKRTLEPSLPPQ